MLQTALVPLLFAATSLPGDALTATDAAATAQDLPPKLVVLVSVDQLIPEQLERLGPSMTGGFARLLTEGVSIQGAELPYARTETGAGHATFATGCLPRTHGVVGNSYYERSTKKERYCVEDPTAELVTDRGIIKDTGKRSPAAMLSPTIAELLQYEYADARLCSISAKDRAAIGMAGFGVGHVVWWDQKRGGGFVSSTPITEELPLFVTSFNRTYRKNARSWVWEDTSPSGEEGERFAEWGTAADERAGERPLEDRVTFPYVMPEKIAEDSLGGYLYGTPAVDGYVADLAIDALDAMALGIDEVPDVLCLSFSGCDVVGHANGPYSREVTDLLFRLDRKLGQLFDELDEHVGKGRWMCALTADHGVLPLPEALVERGIDARRIHKDEVAAMRARMTDMVEAELGARLRIHGAPGGYRLNAASLEASGVDEIVARRAVARALRDLRVDYPWIEDAYAYDEIARFGPDQLGARALLRNSFHPGRTADVVLLTSPHALLSLQNGTSHGTHHLYDRRIPIVFMGPGVERIAVKSPGPFTPSRAPGSQDIVPTLFELMGITPADVRFDGRSLLAR